MYNRCSSMSLGTVLRIIYPEPFRDLTELTRLALLQVHRRNRSCRNIPIVYQHLQGAIITVIFAWVCQPWQLVNRASIFPSVVSSFFVFLAPIMGVMVTGFIFVRGMRLKLDES